VHHERRVRDTKQARPTRDTRRRPAPTEPFGFARTAPVHRHVRAHALAATFPTIHLSKNSINTPPNHLGFDSILSAICELLGSLAGGE
jgi:hypothetical protein